MTEQIQFYLMQRFPTRQNHDYRMDPNDDPIYDEYTSSGNNVTEEDRHWNFNEEDSLKKEPIKRLYFILYQPATLPGPTISP